MEINIKYNIKLDTIANVVENKTGKRPTEKEIESRVLNKFYRVIATVRQEYLNDNNIELSILEVIYPELEKKKNHPSADTVDEDGHGHKR
jgi:hypothetical protein